MTSVDSYTSIDTERAAHPLLLAAFTDSFELGRCNELTFLVAVKACLAWVFVATCYERTLNIVVLEALFAASALGVTNGQVIDSKSIPSVHLLGHANYPGTRTYLGLLVLGLAFVLRLLLVLRRAASG